MQTDTQIIPVSSKKLKKDFLQLPWKIYKNDPFWIPPLLMAVEQSLDTQKHPFFKHARIQLWNAYQGQEIVGRIAAVIDDNHNHFQNEDAAFWGFFECIDDVEVARSLFKVAEGWACQQGMKVFRGPMNPSTNYECGLQISAFDTTPFIMMTQNPSYYAALVEACGYSKAKDLFAWLLDPSVTFDSRLIRHAERLATRAGITVRTAKMSHFSEEVKVIREIYNDAWEKNWGFVPMTDDEFQHMAKDMKAILIPELVFIAEVKGEPAAFSVWLPDVNQAMAKVHDGKLFPTGLMKLLWHTKISKKTINRGRVLTLGVKKKFQHLALAPLLYMKYYKEAPSRGYPVAECSWILEDNGPMNHGLEQMKATHYKTYRIYDKALLN